MSLLRRAFENFKMKYLKILSDTNIRKYKKKKYNFSKFLSYLLVLYVLSISIFIIIWGKKNDEDLEMYSIISNKTYDYSINQTNYRVVNLMRHLDVSKNKSLFIKFSQNNNLVSNSDLQLIFGNNNIDTFLNFENVAFSQENFIDCIKKGLEIKEIYLSSFNTDYENKFWRLLENFISSDYGIKAEVINNSNYTKEAANDNNLTTNPPQLINKIKNLILLQGSIILFQTLILISFISFSFVKFRFWHIIYKIISFFCCFNNFIQFQLLAFIFSKLLKNDFHSRFTVPYIHSATTIFFTTFIDSDYIINSAAALFAGILICIFSIGYDWMDDFYFIVGGLLLLAFCYFTFKIEIDKQNLFLIDENNKNNLKNLMNSLENLNSGIIVYRKNEYFECNQKFFEIFKINLDFAEKQNLNKDYLRFILFTHLTEFNNNLGKSFLKTLESYHQKFLEYERNLFDLILAVEELKRLEEEITIDDLVNDFENNQNELEEANENKSNSDERKKEDLIDNEENKVKSDMQIDLYGKNNENFIQENGSILGNINLNNSVNNNSENDNKILRIYKDEPIKENGNNTASIIIKNELPYIFETFNKKLNGIENKEIYKIVNEESNLVKDKVQNLEGSNILIDFQKVNFNTDSNTTSNNVPNVNINILSQNNNDSENYINLNKKNLINTSNSNSNKFLRVEDIANSLTTVKSGELKRLIKSKTLRNTILVSSGKQGPQINGLQQSIHDIEKKSKFHKKENENSFNFNESNLNLFSFNNFNNYDSNNIELLHAERKNNTIQNNDTTNINVSDTLKVNPTKSSKLKLKPMRKSLYSRLKQDDLRAQKNAQLIQLRDKIKVLRNKISESNEDFVNFKTFFFNNSSSAKYTYLATKRFTVDNEEYVYRIYFRYNDMSDSLEFLIDDLSTVLRMEDLKSQFKYKKYFLDKFSHEFRNPILNIKQLVKNVKILYDEYCSKLKKAMNFEAIRNSNLFLNEQLNRDIGNNPYGENENTNKAKILFLEGVEISGTKLNMNLNEENKTYKSVDTENKQKSAFLNADNILPARNSKSSSKAKGHKDEIHKSTTSTAIIKKNSNFLAENLELDNYKKKSHHNLSIYSPIDLKNESTKRLNVKGIKNPNNNDVGFPKNIKFLDTHIINNSNIYNVPKQSNHILNTKILDKSNPIFDQLNIKDTTLLPDFKEIKHGNPNTSLKKLIFSKKTKEEMFSDLRHSKNLCEYMSLLISDFDYISNSQTNFLEKSKTMRSISAYTNRNNMNSNLKEPDIIEGSGPDYSRIKSQSEINRNSNRNSILNKEHYIINNSNSNNAAFGSSGLNRIGARDIIIEKTSFEIKKFLKYLVKIFESKIFLSDKKINLEYSISQKVPEKITHDQAKIKLIIFNLLCNSVKFTANGLIRVEVDTDNNNLIFNILDSGIGIKEDNIEKLLLPINMINISENTQQGGMGMGFFVVRRYLDMLGGNMIIESCYGLGTLIELKIPFFISRTQTTYTLLVNEKSALDHALSNQNFNSFNIVNAEKKPLKYRSYKPIIDKKIKEKFEINSVSFEKSRTGNNQNIYLVTAPNSKSLARDIRQKSNSKKIDLKNLKTNTSVNYIRNNYYYNNNNNLVKIGTKQTINNQNNLNLNSRGKDLSNTELYASNFFRPNLIDDLRSTNIKRKPSIQNVNNHLASNRNTNLTINNNLASSPASNYNLNFLEKEAKTVILSDPNLIVNYNTISPNLKFIECNTITPRNVYGSENSENIEENSLSQSNVCFSQDDLRATIRINNQNLNVNNLILGENVYYINNTSASNLQNKKSRSTTKSNFSIIYKNSTNNLNNYNLNFTHSATGNNTNTVINRNNTNNYNLLNNNKQINLNSSNNIYSFCHKNSLGSNDIANSNYNAQSTINNKGGKFNQVNKSKAPSEQNKIVQKKMVKYSQKMLNNFVSFQNSIRILLVDDERLIRQSGKNVINKYFKKKGISFEIEECADGIECLYKIYEGIKNGIKYDLIITDETMNFMKGSTTADILRTMMKDNIMYYLKIVMVTSYEISTIGPNIKKNLDKIFTKPLSTNTLDLIFA